MSSQLQWRFRHFDLYTAREWHAMLKLRAGIFVVEQGCPYLDPDGKDPECWHLEGFLDGSLIAGMRIVPPGVSYAEVSIGRVVIATEYRGRGWGRDLMIRGIACSRSLWPLSCPLISARLGLEASKFQYMMLRSPQTSIRKIGNV